MSRSDVHEPVRDRRIVTSGVVSPCNTGSTVSASGSFAIATNSSIAVITPLRGPPSSLAFANRWSSRSS
jgi:hypothetical protein